MSDYIRPSVPRWFWYALGGGLPSRNHSWVLHDVTCRTWVLRHAFRGFLQVCVPAVLVVLLLPAPMYIRVLTAIAAGGPCLLAYLIMIIPMTEHRLIKAGYRPIVGEQIRANNADGAQVRANHARRERIAARREARRSR